MAERKLTVTMLGDSRGAMKAMGDVEGKAGQLGKALAVGAAVGAAAIVGLGAAALKFGGEFDKAYDTIRIGTGATGKQLEGLQDDFKAVVASVPTDFATAGTAVADLNTRLGLTGKPLQDMAKQVINLSRITGTDLAANVAATTRLFGDWSIATDDQAETLDKMFRAAQSTGIGVDGLMQRVVDFGAPLRQMGFSLDESAALLGKWEKEGVNSEAILGALKIGVANFAKAGVDAGPGLQKFLDEVTALGPGAEATTLAIKTFGSRAGPDMVAAVLEGRFAIEDYLTAIEGGTDTINVAAAETDSWREKLTVLKNQVLVGLEPVLMAVFDAVGKFADVITERLLPAITWFMGDISWMVENGAYLADIVAGDKPATMWQRLAVFIATVAIFIRDDLIPVMGTLVYTFENDVRPKLETFVAILREHVIPAVLALGSFVRDHLFPPVKAFIDFLAGHKEFIVGFGVAIMVMLVPAFVAWAVSAGAAAVATVVATAPIIAITLAIAALVGGIIWLVRNWDLATEAMGRFVGWMSDQFFAFLDSKFAWLMMILGPVGLLVVVYKFRDKFVSAFEWVRDRVMPIINGIRGAIDAVVSAFQRMPSVGDIPGAGAVGGLLGRIPGFDSGGIVPGPRGAPQLIMAHGGETVLPTHKGGGGGTVININVTAGVGDPDAIGRQIAQYLNRAALGNGPLLSSRVVQ